MKRRLFFAGFILVILAVVFTGCSLFAKDIKIGGGLIRDGNDAGPLIAILDADDNLITDASVSVDGVNLYYAPEMMMYTSENHLSTSDGKTHHLKVVYESKTYEASVTMPNIPTLTVPNPYDASVEQTLPYSIGAVPDRLGFSCSFGPDIYNLEQYQQEVVNPAESGSFTIPADTFGAGDSVIWTFTAANNSTIDGLTDSGFAAASPIINNFNAQ